MFKLKKLYMGFLVIVLITLGIPKHGWADTQSVARKMNAEVTKIHSTKASRSLVNTKNLYQVNKSQVHIAETKPIDLSRVNNRQIIIKWAEGKTFNASKFGLISLPVSAMLKKENIYLVKVPESLNYQKMLQRLKQQPEQVSVEPDYLTMSSYVPSDSGFSKQGYLRLLHLPEAWDITKGSADVTVAVLDTGVNATHPELQGRLLPGFDFVNNDADPSDDNGHGTHVAGIIASSAIQTGMVGIDLKANILPIKVSSNAGTGSVSNAIMGIYYAIEHGANVINMSYSSYEYTDVEAEAINDAYEHGIVLVAAAGNDGTDDWSYPASYPQVISVGSTNMQDELSDFSNYGDFIDLTAPGEDIVGPNYLGGYQIGSGTSFSAPIVSGIASLIISEHPDWSPKQVEWALELSCSNTVAGSWNRLFGYGRVDAYRALTVQLPSIQEDAPDDWNDAKLLNLNETVSDKINMPMDDDWYRFEISSQTDITIQISNESDHLDLVGAIFQRDGNQLVEKDVIDDGNSGEEETYSVRLKAGTYYVAIYDFFNHWSSENYQLKIAASSRQPENPTSFSDISHHWARADIENLASQGFITGYPNGNFGPDDPITRASAATLISRIAKLPKDGITITYTDVSQSHWAYGSIAAVTNAGIMIGDERNRFNPDARLTREEMAAILVRTFHLTGTTQVSFSDVKANVWSYPYINTLVANNIAEGYLNGTFAPKRSITRAEFVTMLARVMKQGLS